MSKHGPRNPNEGHTDFIRQGHRKRVVQNVDVVERTPTSSQKTGFGSGSFLSVLFAVGVALLPRLVCPCQMPAYVGLLGSLGLAFLTETVYLFPLTTMCLTFAVGGLVIGAGRRRGYAPFAVGAVAAVLLLVGKFYLSWNPLVYGGSAMLLAASLWNSWPPLKLTKLQFHPDGTVEAVERS